MQVFQSSYIWHIFHLPKQKEKASRETANPIPVDGNSLWKGMQFQNKIIFFCILCHLSPLTPNPEFRRQTREYPVLKETKAFFQELLQKNLI